MTLTTEPPPKDQRKKKRSPLVWVAVAAVVVVVLAVGVPFVYIHFLSSDQPAPLALSSGPSTSASASASSTTAAGSSGGAATSSASLDGAWTVASGSQAGYRVSEVLVGQSTEAVGRTSSVIGDATIAGDKLTATNMSVDMASVASDKSQRDSQFQRVMATSQFPTATFKLTKPIDLSALPTDGSAGTTTAAGDLTLHGVTKTVDIPLQVKQDGSDIDVQGSLKITFADYGVANPSAGPAQVGDDGTLEFLVKLAKS